MVPAAVVDQEIANLEPLLSAGDVIIDGGNSNYRDDLRRGGIGQAGIHYLDVGTSGGIAGGELGYCLMIGGEPPVSVRSNRFSPRWRPVEPRRRGRGHGNPRGYLHCGPHGAGHFVKMVHNGIEYGVMAAFAEGFNILHNADIGTRKREADAETTPLAHPEFFHTTSTSRRSPSCGATAA